MPDGGYAMTKFTLDIDMNDRAACELGIRQLWTALIDHRGECEAQDIWRKNDDLNEERRVAWIGEHNEFRDAISALSYENQCLVFRYFAMPKPSKRGLAKMLAAGNYQSPGWSPNYYVDVSEESIKRQLNRVFLDYPEQCRVIGASRPALRQEALRHADFICRVNKDAYLQEIIVKHSPTRPSRIVKRRPVTKKRTAVTR